jgi:cyclic beta-1,2-glucan synthetase
VSDVYQDVFGEGSFIGKGIYDVDAFEQPSAALSRKPHPQPRPAGRLLRPLGLLSDVQLYEDYPARYSADVDRRHRWIRGDWQLAGWLLRAFPAAGRGAGCRIRCRSLSQWKLIDNLRRSLVPAALTLLLLLGWTLLRTGLVVDLAVIGILLIPPLLRRAARSAAQAG